MPSRPISAITSPAAAACLMSLGLGLAWGQTGPELGPIVAQLRPQNPAAALAETQTLLHRYPRDCRLFSLQGIAYSSLHRPPDALRSFAKALTLCPDSLPALEGAAQLRFAAADPAAKPLLQRILALQPADPTSHAMLATLPAGTLVHSNCCFPAARGGTPQHRRHPQPGHRSVEGRRPAHGVRYPRTASGPLRLAGYGHGPA